MQAYPVMKTPPTMVTHEKIEDSEPSTTDSLIRRQAPQPHCRPLASALAFDCGMLLSISK